MTDFLRGLRKLVAGAVLALGVFLAPSASADPGPFAEMEAFSDPRLSPDGQRVAAICAGRGVRSVCVFDLAGQERPRLYEPPERASVNSFYWASTRHLIIDVEFAYRAGRSDAHTVYRNERGVILNVETGATPFILQNMRNYNGSTNNVVSTLTSDPDAVIVQLRINRGDTVPDTGTRLGPNDSMTMLQRVDLNTGRGARMSQEMSQGRLLSNILSPDGRIIARTSRLTGTDAISLLTPQGRTLFQSGRGQSPGSIWLIEGGAALGLVVSSGPQAGMHRLDLESGELTPIELDIDFPGIGSVMTDMWTRELTGFSFMRDDLPDQAFSDPVLREVHATLTQAFEGFMPGARVRLSSWSQDRSVFTVSALQPGRPEQHYLFETATSELSILGSQAPDLDEAGLGAVEAFSYEASDGLVIPAFLTLPPGKTRSDGPFALIAMPHGGPQSRDDRRFDWWAQYYASLGYAVLQPNFRGSSGYGHSFLHAGNGEFGGRMIQDIADGAAHLASEGVAREGGYCAAGASYGGYAALMLGLLDRDNVRCIISFAPVTDPVELVSQGGASGLYWERYIGPLAAMRANPASISPARRANEFTAPILLAHGVEDSTVPVSESRHLERVMRRSGRIRYIEMRGIDHYLTTADSRRQLLNESTTLLNEHFPAH